MSRCLAIIALKALRPSEKVRLQAREFGYVSCSQDTIFDSPSAAQERRTMKALEMQPRGLTSPVISTNLQRPGTPFGPFPTWAPSRHARPFTHTPPHF